MKSSFPMAREKRLRIPILVAAVFLTQMFFEPMFLGVMATGLYADWLVRINPIMNRILLCLSLLLAHVLANVLASNYASAGPRYFIRLNLMAIATLISIFVPAGVVEFLLIILGLGLCSLWSAARSQMIRERLHEEYFSPDD